MFQIDNGLRIHERGGAMDKVLHLDLSFNTLFKRAVLLSNEIYYFINNFTIL